jgi:hypothetical protein
MAQQKQKPVHEIRVGRIRATIWANGDKTGKVWLKTTLSRLYKDGDQWKDTTSYDADDLPVVAKVADMAFAWIRGQEVPADPVEAVE